MNTGILSSTGNSVGVGFAVPVTTVRRVVPDLVEYGRVRKGSIGVRLVPERVSARAGIQGVVVGRVQPGSPADRAGLQGLKRGLSRRAWIGDVIVGIDGVDWRF